MTELRASEVRLEERLEFETLLTDISVRFVNLPADRIDSEIEEALHRVCECLGPDLSALWQWSAETPGVFTMTHLYRPWGGPPPLDRMEAQAHFPWSLEQVMAGKVIAVAAMEEPPAEAARVSKESMITRCMHNGNIK